MNLYMKEEIKNDTRMDLKPMDNCIKHGIDHWKHHIDSKSL